MTNLLKRRRLIEDYQVVFSSPQGQRVLKHIAEKGFVYDTTFVIADEPMSTLNEGSRRLALAIIKMVYRDKTSLNTMIEESQKREEPEHG